MWDLKGYMEGKIEGKPRRGRPRIPLLKQVIEATEIETYWEFKRVISDRDKWREISIIIWPVFRLKKELSNQ